MARNSASRGDPGAVRACEEGLQPESTVRLILDPRGEGKFLKPLLDRGVAAEMRVLRVGDCQIEAGGLILHRIERKQLPDLQSSFSDARFSRQMQAMVALGPAPGTDEVVVRGSSGNFSAGISQQSDEKSLIPLRAALLLVCSTRELVAPPTQPYLRKAREVCTALGVQLVHVSGDEDVVEYYFALYSHYVGNLAEYVRNYGSKELDLDTDGHNAPSTPARAGIAEDCREGGVKAGAPAVTALAVDAAADRGYAVDWRNFITAYFGRNEAVRDRFLSLFPTARDLELVPASRLPLLLSKHSIPADWVERIVADLGFTSE